MYGRGGCLYVYNVDIWAMKRLRPKVNVTKKASREGRKFDPNKLQAMGGYRFNE
jgi:hypothetical protein